jgi:hypothetical protein
MSIIQNFPASLTLAQLQELVDHAEPGVGPVDALSVSQLNNSSITAITFDTAVIITSPVSVLVEATGAAPPSLIPMARGQCLIVGQVKELIAYVAKDENLLAARSVSCLQAFGWSREQAIAIASSIKSESSFNPAAVGDENTGSPAYGLCQWRGSRQIDFENSQHRPLNGSTFHEQLEFISWELDHTEHVAGGLLRAANTIEDATKVVCVKYERPQNPAIATATRIAYAKQLDGNLA